VARRLTHDASVAEDLAQETMLEAWKSFHGFEPGTNCRAWLYKIFFAVRARYLQAAGRAAETFEYDADPERIAVFDPPTPRGVAREDIVGAFGALPDAFKAVVTLADIEGFSYREVAEVLSMPIGTVMSRLSRGRKLLRQYLAAGAAGNAASEKGRHG